MKKLVTILVSLAFTMLMLPTAAAEETPATEIVECSKLPHGTARYYCNEAAPYLPNCYDLGRPPLIAACMMVMDLIGTE